MKQKIKNKINSFIRRSYWFNEELFPDCRKFWIHNTFNLDFVNLGSTSALNAFNYSDVSLKCVNWALRAHNLRGDLLILQNYYSYIKPGGIVALPLFPFSAISGEWEYMSDRYYTILKLRSIPHFAHRRRSSVMEMYNNPIQYFPVVRLLKELKLFVIKPKARVLSEEEMEANACNLMKAWMREFSIYDMEYDLDLVNKDALDGSIRILRQIIDFCLERELTPVIVVPPVYHTLSDKFSEKTHRVLDQSLITNAIRPGVQVLNYFTDKQFSNKKELFKDSFLLNSKGAKQFTKRLLSDLNLLPSLK